MRRWAFPCVVMAAIAGPVHAQDGWVCVGDQAAGMRYDRSAGVWAATAFRPGAEAHIVRRSSDHDVAIWRELLRNPSVDFLWVAGELDGSARYPCEGDFRYGRLRCRIAGSIEFTLNRDTLRYKSYYEGGWLSGRAGDESDMDSPSITIGRCSPL